jgi:1-acyl-sn-glycerol-3-phosphate acyltransferase
MSDRAPGLARLQAAYELGAMLLGYGLLALICLAWLPFALLFNPLLPRRWGEPVGRLAIMWAFRIYLRLLELLCACRFDLAALDALPAQGPLVLAANHPSLLDAVMIVSRLPNAVCVMKAALMDNLLFGSAARLARYIRNDAPLRLIRDAREVLRRGAQLVIFPEGSRTRTPPMDRCSGSAALIAARSGVPVQCLLIEFSSPYLGKGWPLWRRPSLPLAARVRVGRRFHPVGHAAAFTREIEQYLRSELAAGAPPCPGDDQVLEDPPRTHTQL